VSALQSAEVRRESTLALISALPRLHSDPVIIIFPSSFNFSHADLIPIFSYTGTKGG
jgi:hypothetical protein